MAEALGEAAELRDVLRGLKAAINHRALAAWDRSAETFSEEIVALNDVDEALRNPSCWIVGRKGCN